MKSLTTPDKLLNLKEAYFLKVIEQLLKDFNLSGIDLNLEEVSKPTELWESISCRLDELTKENPEKIRALLYRVDLDEDLINKRVLENSENTLSQELSKLILLRLIQKIESRSKYA